jgi:hypothetical protein
MLHANRRWCLSFPKIRSGNRNSRVKESDHHPMFAIIDVLGTFIADLFNSRGQLEVEDLFLRHPLNITLRPPPQRLRLRGSA